VRNQEPCPLKDSTVISAKFTCDGGVMVIEEYGLEVTVPRGAIKDNFVVEIQAAASLFGPFAIPNDCHPVSPYVWIAANYTFQKPVEIQIEHHADVSNSEDISKLCVLKSCCTKCNSHHLKMRDVTQKCLYDISDSFCTLLTNHFCSYCLAKKSIEVPDRIVVYHYLPEDYQSAETFRAELCFCYDLNVCKKVNLSLHL